MSKETLYTFITIADGFDIKEKLKLVLFTAELKPSTYVILKINPESLDEKYRFEQLLRQNKILFSASRQKGYEEITKIKGNKIIWELKGIWIGYDLFKDKKTKKLFERYKNLISKQQIKKADLIGGKIYSYPSCCIKQYQKETSEYIKKHYTYYEFYKKLQDIDRKYPFIAYSPCSVKCKKTTALNKKYSNIIKKFTPELWQQYTKKDRFKTDIIVDEESDILIKGKTIWPERNAHEYDVILRKPHNNKYYLYAYLTKKNYEKGTILEASITQQYDYADIKVKKVKGIIKNLIHERKMPLIGRKY
ncbi:DUF483 domain-containing protein [Candidatus Woesearchaeota archaeon]|nr:DUF483 domain-containing protein [Candidatus Woesearchaeota archaeon]